MKTTNKQMKEAERKLARLAASMGGTLSKNGRWFDLPADQPAVGYGIVNGRHGVAIVSVPR